MAKKKVKETKGSPLFEEILNETSAEEKAFVTKSMEIAAQISMIMEKRGMKQKDLAELLGKSEAEISKWLSGFHNLTLKSVTLIESKLNVKIIMTPHSLIEESIFNYWLSRPVIQRSKIKTEMVQYMEGTVRNCKVVALNPKKYNFEEVGYQTAL